MSSPNGGRNEFNHQVAIKLSRALNTLNPNDLLAQRVIDIAKTNSIDGFIAGTHTHPFVYFPGIKSLNYELLQRLRLLASLKIHSCRSSMQKSCCMQSRKPQVSRLIPLKESQLSTVMSWNQRQYDQAAYKSQTQRCVTACIDSFFLLMGTLLAPHVPTTS